MKMKMANNQIFDQNDNGPRIVTYAQLKRFYILLAAKERLANGQGAGIDLSVQQVANALCASGEYRTSLGLLREFSMDCKPIFDKMMNEVLLLREREDENEHDLDWQEMESILMEYDGIGNHFEYTLNALRCILSSSSKVKIPSFVINLIEQLAEDEMDAFIVPLIDLLCEYGQILASIRILCRALNVTQQSSIVANDGNYNYQNHAFWSIAQKLFAYCSTLSLQKEQNTLMQSMANWIARPQQQQPCK